MEKTGQNLFDTPECVRAYASGEYGDKITGELSAYAQGVYSVLGKALPGAGSLLDVGCATANVYEYLRMSFPQVAYTGMDLSRAMLRQARDLHDGAALVAADMAHPPFRDQSFDVVLCTGVLQFADNPFDVFQRMYSLCRKTLIAHFPVSLTKPTRRVVYTSKNRSMPAVISNLLDLRQAIEALDSISPINGNVQIVTGMSHASSVGFSDIGEEQIYLFIVRVDRLV